MRVLKSSSRSSCPMCRHFLRDHGFWFVCVKCGLILGKFRV